MGAAADVCIERGTGSVWFYSQRKESAQSHQCSVRANLRKFKAAWKDSWKLSLVTTADSSSPWLLLNSLPRPLGHSRSHGGLSSAPPRGRWSPQALGNVLLLAAMLSQSHLAFVSGDGAMKACWKLVLFDVTQRRCQITLWEDTSAPQHSHDNIVVIELSRAGALGGLQVGELELDELLLNSWITCYNFSSF